MRVRSSSGLVKPWECATQILQLDVTPYMPGVYDTGQPLDSSLSWHDKSDAGAGLAVPVLVAFRLEGDCEVNEHWKR